jgi:glycosyltransferase involved in cell wall biosynthesis
MSKGEIVVNGHFRGQMITGVQRYAIEVLRQFDRMEQDYRVEGPPKWISSQPVKHLWMQSALPLKLRKGDLLWSPTNLGAVAHSRQVVTLHDIADQLFPEWYSRQYVGWRKFFLPRLLSRVEGVITVSEYSKRMIEERYPQSRGKIEVIDNGIDRNHFRPMKPDEIGDLSERFGLNGPYAITVSSLDPRKNISGLLEAWNKLPQRVRDGMDLVIIGGEADIFSFELDVEIDPSVKFLGYVGHEDLPRLYSGAEFFVYPSLYEGFGLPVIEAMACRVPVITSNNTSLIEVAGDHALTVPPGDCEAIAAEILRLAESDTLKEEIAEKGYRHSEKYSWKRTAAETLHVLNRYLG